MKITTTEATRVNALATDLIAKAQAVIDAASVPNTAPFEMGGTIDALNVAMDNMRNGIPTVTSPATTGAAGTTVAGPASTRAKVQAGADS